MLAHAATPALRWFVVDASAITNLDYTATEVLRDVKKQLAERGTGLALANVDSSFNDVLVRHDLTATIGSARIFNNLSEALGELREMNPECK